MADWPLGGGGRVETIAATFSGTTGGTAVVSGSSANTKGAWSELSAATPCAASAILITVNFGLAAYLMDIGIGPDDANTHILIPDIHRASADLMPTSFLFPVRIPRGSRVVARSQATITSSSTSTTAYLITHGFGDPVGYNRVTAYGVTTGDSGGTSIDPGTSQHTKGTWVQITSAPTVVAHKAVAVAIGNQANPAATGTTWLFDIGIGPSDPPDVAIANYRISASAFETVSPPFSPFFPMSIPAGSRLWARSQSINTDATDRLLDVVLYGVS